MQRSSSPNASFQERLARLSTPSETRHVREAPETLMSRVAAASMKAEEAAKAEKKRMRDSGPVSAIPDWRENIKYPLTFVKAAVLGMMGAFFGKYVAITMFSRPEGSEFDMMGYYLEMGVAFAAAVMVKEIFRIEGEHLRKAQVVGVVFMVGMVHNFAFWAPSLFEKVYSPEWVERTQERAVANSFMFQGDYYVFSQEDKPRKPRRIR